MVGHQHPGEPPVQDTLIPARWCALEKSLDLIGTKSAVRLLCDVFYGARRFDDLVRRTGLAESLTATRLREMVTFGILARRPYREPGARTRNEYVLTDLGRALFPFVVALMRWGYMTVGERCGVDLVHAGCGSPLTPTVRCAAGHDVPIEESAVSLRTRDDSEAAEERGGPSF
jgi:DNA-binding HxlR family transcriptional regulator